MQQTTQQLPQISVDDAMKCREEFVFIDTRSPKEFAQDCLPNAVNIPILSNEERAVVGTLYKKTSREAAIEKGIEFFSQKLPQFMREVSKYKDTRMVIYCWRGGMRSKTITGFLAGLGYDVVQMVGGYNAYRTFIRRKLENYVLKPRLVVLCGLTCTGKTTLLQKLPNSLDLEGLAQHRGSLYGAIGLQPRTQKAFENLLYWELERLQQNSDYIFVEGEGRKIGNIMIPVFLWKAMKSGEMVRVTRSMEKRVDEALANYGHSKESVKEVISVTKSLWKVVGKKRKQEIVGLLEEGELREGVRLLLEYYYDPLYEHTLKSVVFEREVNSDNILVAAEKLCLWYKA